MSDEQFIDANQRYRLESRIAIGGMGEVWRGTDTVLGRSVAVKVLKAEYASDATFRSRFSTEARHAAALQDPGIAGVFDYSDASLGEESRPYLVMELVEGQPLSALLAQGRTSGREMDPDVVRDLMAQAGKALGTAHAAGIVHRDIKPANIMVTEGGTVKITDFGIARAADGVGMTQTGAVMGTPQYLSPEQARGEKASAASDVYSLGVVAFECLVGRRPFEADGPVATALAHLQQPVPELPSSVPADLAAVVRQAMAKDPAERFAGGAEFAAALRGQAPGTSSTRAVPPVSPAAAGAAAAAAASSGQPESPPTAVLNTGVGAPVPPPRPTPTPATDETKSGGLPPGVAVVIGVLVVALLVLGAILLSGGDDEDPTVGPTDEPSASESESPSESPSPSEEPTEEEPETVNVDANNYIGRSFDEVATELRDQGLQVTGDRVDNPGDQVQDTVKSLNPTGNLEPGTVITVEYWGEAPEPEPTPTPTPEPTPTPSDDATGNGDDGVLDPLVGEG